MITYNELCELKRKEMYSDQLQPLPKGFLEEVAVYLKDKEQIAKKDDDLFSDTIKRTKKQLDNAVLVFRELLLRRKKKLLELAFVSAETGISKRDFDNMLQPEKEVFDKIMKAVNDGDRDIEKIMSGKKEEENGEKHKMIIFKHDTGEFLDLEGNKLGPFKEGDITNLSQEIANILIVDGKADPVDEE